jgi:hypothetical protein
MKKIQRIDVYMPSKLANMVSALGLIGLSNTYQSVANLVTSEFELLPLTAVTWLLVACTWTM